MQNFISVRQSGCVVDFLKSFATRFQLKKIIVINSCNAGKRNQFIEYVCNHLYICNRIICGKVFCKSAQTRDEQNKTIYVMILLKVIIFPNSRSAPHGAKFNCCAQFI